MSERLMSDSAAREAARTIFERPVVLRAGAGTGKTAALVARVVTWLVGPGWERAEALMGPNPEGPRIASRALRRVVAITFTEAAAAEMAERVAEALYALSTGCSVVGLNIDDLPVDAQGRARILLPAVDQMEVRTIHAWCRNILVEFPLEANLHPMFEVDAAGERTASIVRKEVETQLSQMLNDDRSHSVLGLFERGLTPTSIEEAVRSLVDFGVDPKQLQVDPFNPSSLNGLWLRLRNSITDVLTVIDQRLVGVRAPNGQATLEALTELRDGLDPGETLGQVQERIATHLPDRLRGHLQKVWVGGKGGKGEIGALEDVAGALKVPAQIVSAAVDCIVGLDPEGYRLAQEVLQPMVRQVRSTMRTQGLIGFTDLLVRAARLLKNQSVAKRVRERIDQLLVDEFQDTDPLQCDIVRALALQGPVAARPGLFLVGDPKQSIYGWRSADLRAYEGFVKEVLTEGGEEHGLVLNFRSTRVILDEVDRCMSGLLVAEPGVQPGHESLVASRGDGPRTSSVEAWVSWDWEAGDPVVPTTSERARKIEARALATDIARLRHEGVCLSEIGVLFRATTHLQIYQWALRDAGIPYEVTRDRNYFRRREVVECAAMVRAVIDPVDTLALVSFLRSSMVNLPDAALLPLWRVGFPKGWMKLSSDNLDSCLSSIEEAKQDCRGLYRHVDQLEQLDGWADHLAEVVRRVAWLRDRFNSSPFDLWIEELRSHLVPDVVNAVAYQGIYRTANIERFFRVVAERVSESSGDVHSVLRHLRDAVAHQREAEESRPTGAGPAVQLMTIHKAKGLAFTHTYLVDLHHRFRGRSIRSGTFPAGSDELQLMGLCTPGFDEIWRRAWEVERAERVRLLYVAMTRARDRLVWMGAWPRELAGFSNAKIGLDLLGERSPALPDACEIAESLPTDSLAIYRSDIRWVFPARFGESNSEVGPLIDEVGASMPLRSTSQAQKDWAESRSSAPWTQGPSAVKQESEAPTYGSVNRGDALTVGTAIHLMMEQIACDQVNPTPEVLNACLSVAAGPGAASPAATERAGQLLEQLRKGALLNHLDAVEVLGTEVPILLDGDAGGPVGAWSGSIDLLYRCPKTSEIVVVDHKTDRVGKRDLQEIADQHAPQGRLYVEAVQKALDLKHPPRFEVWLIEADSRVVVR